MNKENLIFWFNIGQNGSHDVMWTCACINGNFDADSIRIESYEYDENDVPTEKWVLPSEYNFHPRVAKAFSDLDRIAELVKESYEIGEDVWVEGKNTLHIHDVFDMDDRNEYGLGKPLWG